MLLSMMGHFNQAIMGHSWRAPKAQFVSENLPAVEEMPTVIEGVSDEDTLSALWNK